MKRWITPGIGLMALAAALLACSITIPYGSGGGSVQGSGKLVSEDRSVSGVAEAELAMGGTLHIVIGDHESLRIEAEDNLLPFIETVMRGDMLLIRTQAGTNVQSTRSIEYWLTVNELTGLSVSSSGDILASSIEGNRCRIDISSSGGISLDSVDCTTLTVSITSSGNAEIAGGSAEQQNIRISSSGDYRAGDVVGSDADITISSSGSATVNVSESITGSINSSGFIYYFGDPRVNVRTSSSGGVEKLGN